MNVIEAIRNLDQEFARLIEVIETNYHAEVKQHSYVILQFIRYYRNFNNSFEQASSQEKQAIYDHILAQHAKLGKTVNHVAEGFGVKVEEVPHFLEESPSLSPADRALRHALKYEIDRLGTALRKFKQSKAPKRRKAPSLYRRKV